MFNSSQAITTSERKGKGSYHYSEGKNCTEIAVLKRIMAISPETQPAHLAGSDPLAGE